MNIKQNTDVTNILRDASTKDLDLVWNLNHEIFNIPQWLPHNVKINIKLQLTPSNYITQKVLDATPDVTVSVTSAILYARKQLVMSSVALAIENLKATVNNIKLLVPHRITNQRHIATGTRTYTDSSFINGEIPSKLALVFVISPSAVEPWTDSPDKFEMFGLSWLAYKINGIPLKHLFFDKSYRTLYKLTMQSLDRDSQLFENGISEEMFEKTNGIIVLAGTQDMSIV